MIARATHVAFLNGTRNRMMVICYLHCVPENGTQRRIDVMFYLHCVPTFSFVYRYLQIKITTIITFLFCYFFLCERGGNVDNLIL